MKLSDVTKDLFEYIVSFRNGIESKSAPEVNTVRQDLEGIFTTMESRAAQDESLKSEYGQVKYALVAMADEAILNSSWSEARKWDRHLLEQRFFSTNIAGNQFFKMLEHVEQMPKEVLKTFYTCLAFGFRGGFAADDPSLLRLRSRLLLKFMPEKDASSAILCPEAYRVQIGSSKKLIPLWRFWHVVIGVLVLTAILILIESVVIWPFMVGDLEQEIDLGSGGPKAPVAGALAGQTNAPGMKGGSEGVRSGESSVFSSGYLVQHGSFSNQAAAASLVATLAESKITASLFMTAETGGVQRFIVLEGPLPSIERASKAIENARSKVGNTKNVNILDSKAFNGTCVVGCPR